MTTRLDLLTERNTVLAQLERRWKWLDEHPSHPQFTEREDACLADLATYERLEDELRALSPTQPSLLDRAATADRYTN